MLLRHCVSMGRSEGLGLLCADCCDAIRGVAVDMTLYPKLTMPYIDFHTHHAPTAMDVIAVVDGRDTWGVHPWHASNDFVVPDLSDRLAIGECGLDALRGPSMETQLQVFRQQIVLSEAHDKPLVIHCVKALDQLLSLHRELRPQMPWMFHGFRGKPQQLRTLLKAGFYVSFGFYYNKESLCLCPLEYLMLETDDEPRPIIELYSKVASERGISVSSFCASMAENYLAFFQKNPFSDIKRQ